MKKITLIGACLATTLCFAQSTISISNIPSAIELSGSTSGDKPIPFTINYDLESGNIGTTAIILKKFDAADMEISAFGEKAIFYKPALEEAIAANGGSRTGSFMIPFNSGGTSRNFYNESNVPPSSTLNAGEYYAIRTYTTVAGVLVINPWSQVTLVANGSTLSIDNLKKQSIKIGPNPVSDILNVDSNVVTKSYSIYDVRGSLVKKAKPNGSVDVSELSQGLYFLKTDTAIVKFIKK